MLIDPLALRLPVIAQISKETDTAVTLPELVLALRAKDTTTAKIEVNGMITILSGRSAYVVLWLDSELLAPHYSVKGKPPRMLVGHQRKPTYLC
jgi:hypothetical protein